MSAAAQVKVFAKSNGLQLSTSASVPMLSRKFPGGAMWIECFDSYPDVLAFVEKARTEYERGAAGFPWSTPNLK